MMKKLIGKNIIIRTVGFYYLGKLEDIDTEIKPMLVLSQACWLADTGPDVADQWGNVLENGFSSNAEIEIYPKGLVYIPLDGLLDMTEWGHDLPKSSQ